MGIGRATGTPNGAAGSRVRCPTNERWVDRDQPALGNEARQARLAWLFVGGGLGWGRRGRGFDAEEILHGFDRGEGEENDLGDEIKGLGLGVFEGAADFVFEDFG